MVRLFKEYDFYGMVHVKTNIPELQDFFSSFEGKEFPAEGGKRVFMHVEQRCRLNVDVSAYSKVGDFLYDSQTDTLYFELPYPFPVQVMASGIVSNNVTILVSYAFLKLPTVVRGGINFTYLFREIFLLKLIDRGCLFLHGASVAFANNGVVMTAFANTGKTYLSYGLVKSGFARLLSDEYTIINKDGLMRAFLGMSALSPLTIKEYAIEITKKEQFIMWFCRLRSILLPFLFEPVIWINAARIFSENRCCLEAQARHLIFLQRGESGFLRIDGSAAVKKLILLTENEFPFSTNYFLQVYSFLRDDFDLNGYRFMAQSIIKCFVEKVQETAMFSFTPGNAERLHSILREHLSGK